jgi:hypothetical protein
VGGVSSSAAVIIAFLTALARVNGIKLGDRETIMMAKAAENRYVGVNCGKLDQSCEVLCRKDHLLYMDCRDDSYELIPMHPDMKPFRIAVLFSGLERSLATSAYNLRQDECKAAAYNLLYFLCCAPAALLSHRRQGLLNARIIVPSLAGALPAAVAARLLAAVIQSVWLDRAFALFLLFMGVRELLAKR